MVKIRIDADCGNSPKREFLKDLNIAFARGDIGFIADGVIDDIVWTIIGDKQIQGKLDFVAELEVMQKRTVAELIVDKIVTHGKEGAANGEIIMSDGKKYAFCDIYEFKGAKGNSIKSISSYMIAL